MSKSREFVRFIPNFNIKPDLGGTLVNETNRDNEISYEAITSKKAVDFSLMEDGFRAMFYGIGLGVKYDTEGNLMGVRIEMLSFLKYLLEEDSVDEISNASIEDFLDLAVMMDESDEQYVVHLDLSAGKCLIYGNRGEDDYKNVKVYASKNIDNFNKISFLQAELGDLTFYMAFGRFEGTFGVGIGMLNEEENNLSEIGNLPGSKDINEPDIAMLVKFLAEDCNYMTFLDSKNANRFEKLTQRIIVA